MGRDLLLRGIYHYIVAKLGEDSILRQTRMIQRPLRVIFQGRLELAGGLIDVGRLLIEELGCLLILRVVLLHLLARLVSLFFLVRVDYVELFLKLLILELELIHNDLLIECVISFVPTNKCLKPLCLLFYKLARMLRYCLLLLALTQLLAHFLTELTCSKLRNDRHHNVGFRLGLIAVDCTHSCVEAHSRGFDASNT